MRLLIVHFSLFLCTVLNSAQSDNWTHYSVLDGEGIYNLYWNPPTDKRNGSEITFKVEIQAKGYFGLGFSPNGGMPGSDIVTGWIKDGEVYFQDRHALAFSLPVKDDQQDYELISAYENETFTVFEFSRLLDTCDENDMVIDDSTMRVIYAYSEDDPASDDPFYHRENRGAKSLLLLRSNGYENDDLNFTNLLTWDVRSPDINISTTDTVYWCKLFRTPQVDEKHHIVRVKALIQEGHESFVHHIVMWECVGANAEEYDDYLDYRGHVCNHPNMPEVMKRCEGLTIAWTVGGEDIVFPEHAGFPIYPAPGRYYELEVHYDNPQLQSGIIDHSGLRFYYTPNLKKYDAANFVIGATVVPRVFIPPCQKEYVVVGHSNPDCIGSAFPDSGVTVFAVGLHSHLIGRKIKVRHFRGNIELSPLADDKNYDFNYQDYRFFSDEVVFLPNDTVTVECTYDSSERTNVTFGGGSTREEMCMFFLLYYPIVSQYGSFSMPLFENINKVLNTNITKEKDVYGVLGNYDWASVDIDEVENAMRNSKHATRCYTGDAQIDINSLVSYPSDLVPYEAESACNSSKLEKR